MEQMTRVKILAMALLFARLASAAEKSNFTFSVAYGPHPVGFRVMQHYDYTRSYERVDAEGNVIPGERARPIQTLIWYPAQTATSAKPMLFGRYLDLMATEDDFTPLNAQQRALKLKALLQANYITKNYEREPGSGNQSLRKCRPSARAFSGGHLCTQPERLSV